MERSLLLWKVDLVSISSKCSASRYLNLVRTHPGCIKSIDVTSILPKSDTVIFRDTPEIPDPNPVLLEANAAVSRTFHMTAMGEQIEKVMRDQEEVHCLASDGSTNLGYHLMVFEQAMAVRSALNM